MGRVKSMNLRFAPCGAFIQQHVTPEPVFPDLSEAV